MAALGDGAGGTRAAARRAELVPRVLPPGWARGRARHRGAPVVRVDQSVDPQGHGRTRAGAGVGDARLRGDLRTAYTGSGPTDRALEAADHRGVAHHRDALGARERAVAHS